METTKKCSKCKRVLPISSFGKHRHCKDGINPECKECNRERNRIFRQTPIGMYTAFKGRAKFYNTKPFQLTKEEFLQWFSDQPKKCVYCDIHLDDLPKLSDPFNNVSHRLTVDCKNNPLGYLLDNIVLACRRCNSVKSDILTFDEMRYVGQNFIKPKWMKRLEGMARDV